MSLTAEQVRQVAHLARLQLRDDELGHYTEQLSSILDLVGQLSRADTAGVQPMAHPLAMVQRLRPDAASPTEQRAEFQALAPAVQDGLYLVPKVIE